MASPERPERAAVHIGAATRAAPRPSPFLFQLIFAPLLPGHNFKIK
jgi:hypothetical protein